MGSFNGVIETRARGIIITIDGPAGSGKSSTAKRVAQLLSYLYLDSGAIYRAVTLQALRLDAHFSDEEALEEIAKTARIEFGNRDGIHTVYLQGEDVTEQIRCPEVTRAIAPVASSPRVRALLIPKQRALGAEGGIVAEGRDMGSVVFPDAELKIYMVASIRTRSRRRMRDMETMGKMEPLSRIERDIEQRDYSDRIRAVSPLVKPKNALMIDTSEMSFEDQVDIIVTKARERGAL